MGLQECCLRALSRSNNCSWLRSDEFENVLEHVGQRKAGWAGAVFHVPTEKSKTLHEQRNATVWLNPRDNRRASRKKTPRVGLESLTSKGRKGQTQVTHRDGLTTSQQRTWKASRLRGQPKHRCRFSHETKPAAVETLNSIPARFRRRLRTGPNRNRLRDAHHRNLTAQTPPGLRRHSARPCLPLAHTTAT